MSETKYGEPKPWELGGHITEIKVSIARMEQMMMDMKEDLKAHSKKDADRQIQLAALKSEMDQAKGSLKTLKWLVPSGPVLMALLFWALRASGKL